MNLQRSTERHFYWYYKIITTLKKRKINDKLVFFKQQHIHFEAVIPKKALKNFSKPLWDLIFKWTRMSFKLNQSAN